GVQTACGCSRSMRTFPSTIRLLHRRREKSFVGRNQPRKTRLEEPTHLTLVLVAHYAMAKKKKRKPFRAVKAVKEAAREQIGTVPPTRLVPDRKKKTEEREKHKPTMRRLLEQE